MRPQSRIRGVTGVDDTYLYLTAQNNASRYTPLTVSQAIPINPAANTRYQLDPTTVMSYTTDASTGNPVVTATSDIGATTLTPVSSSQTDYTDSASFSSQRVNADMALPSASGNGQTCGGHGCSYAAPQPTPTPSRGRLVDGALRRLEDVTWTCITSASGTASAILNVASKFVKVGMTSGAVVVTVLPEVDLLAVAAATIMLGVAVVGDYVFCYATNKAKPQ